MKNLFSLNAEKQVLGAMMLDNLAVTTAIEILKPESFYNLQYQEIFCAIQQLFADDLAIDLLSIDKAVKSNNPDSKVDFMMLTDISTSTPTSAMVKQHAYMVQEYHIKRQMVGYAKVMVENSDNKDVFELLEESQSYIENLLENNNSTLLTPSQLGDLLIEQYNYYSSKDKSFPKSGIDIFDRNFGAFLPGQFVVIAARPSIGKSALAQSIAKNMFDNNIPVAFISLEMSAYELLVRWTAMETGENSEFISAGMRTPKIEYAVNNFAKKIINKSLYLDDASELNEVSLYAKLKRMVSMYKIKVAFVDYIGLMNCSSKKSNRAEEISTITRKIKMIAKRLQITIFGLVQINREAEKGKFPTPAIHHLRDSGSIEQDADVIILIDRPEHYGYDTFEDKEPCLGKARLIVGKKRGGKTGVVTVNFRNYTTEFFDNSGFEPQSQFNENVYEEMLTDDDVDVDSLPF